MCGWLGFLGGWVGSCLIGCRSETQNNGNQSQQTAAQTTAATQPAPVVAAKQAGPAILPESHAWTREQAVERLNDEKTALSAAVRLARLADIRWPTLPEPLPAATAAKLRVLRVSETQYVLGLGSDQHERAVRVPLLIETGGTVVPLSEPEDYLVFYVSRDVEIFPHLLIGAGFVTNFAQRDRPAIMLKTGAGLRFELRTQNDYPYVGLMCPQATPPAEVARYAWDPYEHTFAGPAIDKLPHPPGGKFEMDLEQSTGLQPVGGEIPEPTPNTPPPGEKRYETWPA